MDESVVHISNIDGSVLGTGFVINKDSNGSYVVTCGHVVNDSDIVVEGNSSSIVKNLYDSGLDLALLYVPGMFKEPFSVCESLDSKDVKVIGFSRFGRDIKKEPVTEVEVCDGIEVIKGENDLVVRALKLKSKDSISIGYSGAPVICKATNRVLGVVNIEVGSGVNYAIHSSHLSCLFNVATFSDVKDDVLNSSKSFDVEKIGSEKYELVRERLTEELESSLESYSTQPKLWVLPRLYSQQEGSVSGESKERYITPDELVLYPKSTVIKARPQYGLTCLAKYLVKEAWESKSPSCWLYLNAGKIKPYQKQVKKDIERGLKKIGLHREDLACVVLDEFSSSINEPEKLLSSISEYLGDTPLVVMMSMSENPLLGENFGLPDDRKFETYYLWAMRRNEMRKLVESYNNEQYVGNVDSVLNKISIDLEVLNIPRTALNCITMLKIHETNFDDSPVNRTEMIRRVLFLLFNVDDIPHYKSRPDLTDTEYVLGYFCEFIIRTHQYFFTRDEFIKKLNLACTQQEMDLDVAVIFDVLYANNIIINRGKEFCFKFSYWVFYFGAHRMHHEAEFADYILNDMKYVSYPELIEFYTGIDRKRDDALRTLTRDIKSTCDIVEKKCNLPEDFDIYGMAKWEPHEKTIEAMNDEIANGALQSNLPDEVKDQYVDQRYDRARPLSQGINSILEDYSLLRLMKCISASSKALRNSDYSSPRARHELLGEICRSWEQLANVLIILSPILAKKGYARLEGASFTLTGNIKQGSEEQVLNNIIAAIPHNICEWYKDDIFSNKMGPLLYNHAETKSRGLPMHLLNLLIVKKRPKGWEEKAKQIIQNMDKNSFYLLDIYEALRTEYQYGFLNQSNIDEVGDLIKLSVAKHGGSKATGKKAIRKVRDSVLPERCEES